jgi:hypothetical protein
LSSEFIRKLNTFLEYRLKEVSSNKKDDNDLVVEKVDNSNIVEGKRNRGGNLLFRIAPITYGSCVVYEDDSDDSDDSDYDEED